MRINKKIISQIVMFTGTIAGLALFGIIVALADTNLPATTEASLWIGMMICAIIALIAVITSGNLQNLGQ
jgi:predicted membrane channel-forming protein YqfA (hemolysin III family)